MDVLAALDLNFAGQAISLCRLLLMNLIVLSHRFAVCPMLDAVEVCTPCSGVVSTAQLMTATAM